MQRVQDATSQMNAKAETIDTELESLVGGLRTTVSELTERLRKEADDLTGQLEELREGLSDIRAAAPARHRSVIRRVVDHREPPPTRT